MVTTLSHPGTSDNNNIGSVLAGKEGGTLELNMCLMLFISKCSLCITTTLAWSYTHLTLSNGQPSSLYLFAKYLQVIAISLNIDCCPNLLLVSRCGELQ